MYMDERMVTFIRSLDTPLPAWLETIREGAVSAHVPIIRPEMCAFLRMLLAAKAPAAILEIGAAVGFSALWMAYCTPDDCRITTIEQNERRLAQAGAHFASCPGGERITLLPGDAAQVLPTLEGPFDLIFLDAAKGQYPFYYPILKQLLAEGGMLVCDNVLQEGNLLESRYAVERRDRTIHKRMRGFLYDCMHDPQMTSCVLPVADGVACCVKREGLHGNEKT